MALLAGTVSFRVRRGKYFVTGVAKYLIVGGSRERERLPKIAVSPCAGLGEGGGGCKYCGVRHVPVRGSRSPGLCPGLQSISACGSQVRCRYSEGFLVPAERETGRAVVRPFMLLSDVRVRANEILERSTSRHRTYDPDTKNKH